MATTFSQAALDDRRWGNTGTGKARYNDAGLIEVYDEQPGLVAPSMTGPTATPPPAAPAPAAPSPAAAPMPATPVDPAGNGSVMANQWGGSATQSLLAKAGGGKASGTSGGYFPGVNRLY